MRGTPSVTPAVLARAVRSPGAAAGPAERPAASNPSRGDLLTVDPDDRRRRARIALLELSVARATEQRRTV